MLLDPNVTHPFVKVHIVDLRTCKYLAKSNSQRPGSYNLESAGLIDQKGKIQSVSVDFILPVATRFFDMRLSGQT